MRQREVALELDIELFGKYLRLVSLSTKSAHSFYANLGGTTEIQRVFVLAWTEAFFCIYFEKWIVLEMGAI